MCEASLLLGFGAVVCWFFYQLMRPNPPSYSSPDALPYESPLGLVDHPDDEWIEWAIMSDVNDED